MKLRPRLSVSLLIILLFLSGNANSQENREKSKELAGWIMKIVVRKAKENEEIKRKSIAYDKKITKSNLGENPPQIVETSIYEIYGNNGKSMERLKEKNGHKVNNARPEISELNLDIILIERYEFDLEGEELINGRGYYIISFKPKEPIGKLPFENRMDEGINRTKGRLYVDMERFYVQKLEGRLTGTFTKALSIFEMKDFNIDMRQEEFEGIIVPSSLVLVYKYRVFWGDTHEKLEYVYSNRKKVANQ